MYKRQPLERAEPQRNEDWDHLLSHLWRQRGGGHGTRSRTGPARPRDSDVYKRQLLAKAERDGQTYAVSLGAASLKELRQLPATLLTGNAGGIVHPVIEPYVLPLSPYEAFTSGQQNNVPLLIGSNADEARALVNVSHVTAATFDSDLERSVGQLPPALVAAYPHATDEVAGQAQLGLERDLRFGWDMWAWARLQAGTGKSPVFYYSFRQQPPFPASSVYAGWGASHFAELWYVCLLYTSRCV